MIGLAIYSFILTVLVAVLYSRSIRLEKMVISIDKSLHPERYEKELSNMERRHG